MTTLLATQASPVPLARLHRKFLFRTAARVFLAETRPAVWTLKEQSARAPPVSSGIPTSVLSDSLAHNLAVL